MGFETFGLRILALAFLGLAAGGCSEPTVPQETKAATKAATTVERPSLTNVYQVAPTIDLLQRIDLGRDVVRGTFRWDDGAMLFSGQQSQANIPVEVPEQYELLMTVARTKGSESLNLGIHFHGVTTTVVIEGWQRRVSALNLVDGKIGLNSDTKTSFPVFKDDQPKTIRVVVRHESILVDVDGAVFIDYRDAPERLSFDERFFRRPGQNQLMIAGWNSTFRVSSFVLKPLGDERVPYSEASEPGLAMANADPNVDAPALPSDTRGNSGDRIRDEAVMADRSDSMDEASASPAKIVVEPKTVDTADDSSEMEAPPSVKQSEALPWMATSDPSTWSRVKIDEHPMRVGMGNGAAIIPLSRSPFFCTIEFEDAVHRYQLYDLRKGTSVGKPLALENKNRLVSQLVESGEHLLTYAQGTRGTELEVYSFVSGERVLTLDAAEERLSDLRRDWLLAGGKLLSIREVGNVLEFVVRSVATSETLAQWDCELRWRDVDAMTVSPGGASLVMVHDRQLSVHALENGRVMGRVALPDSVDEILGMAFNTEADELALVASYEDKPSSQLWCLDWTSGETTLLQDTGFKLDSLHRVYNLGPSLEWVPGDELLLFYGRDLIDRTTGRFFYRIPENVYWQMPRRPLSPTSLLAMMRSDDPLRREYRAVNLDRAVMSDALKVIRAGGMASDIGLPPLSLAVTSKARTVSANIDSDLPFEIQAENVGGGNTHAVKLPVQLSRFEDIDSKIKRIHVVGSALPVAVAHCFVKGVRADESQDFVVRYDLQRGKQTSSLPIRNDYQLVDVSPSGRFALIGRANEVNAFSRVDVVDLEQSKHVSGWYPYSDQSFLENVDELGQPAALDPQTASWARFVDEEHVVTVNPAGRLVLWSVSGCEAKLIAPDFGRPFDLSVGGRYVCGSSGYQVTVIDLIDGSIAGVYAADEQPQAVLRAAFIPDGKELAAVLGYQGRRVLQFWDTSSGMALDHFDLPFASVSPGWDAYDQPSHRRIGLEFKRVGFLLLDDLYLIDRIKKGVSWSYGIRSGKHVVAKDAEHEWFVQQVSGSGAQGQYWDWKIDSHPVPSDAVIEKLKNVGQIGSDLPTGRSILSMQGEQLPD